jgi:hypothetical protein
MPDPTIIEEVRDLRISTNGLAARLKIAQRLRRVWMGVVVIVLVLFGLFTWSAIEQSKTGSCVNNILGDRNGLTSSQTAAESDFVDDLAAYFSAPQSQQAAIYAKFIKDLAVYKKTLNSNQAYRVAHPFGHC